MYYAEGKFTVKILSNTRYIKDNLHLKKLVTTVKLENIKKYLIFINRKSFSNISK